jgi:hypothetical protein
MENQRDGLEDYEALAMRADLTACLEKASGPAELVAQVRAVLSE